MRLEALYVRNFRSASSVDLEALGGLNILVGKNNSGKSTLLAAISGFFEHFRLGGVVTLDLPDEDDRPIPLRPPQPSFMREVDYHSRHISAPIHIEAILGLTADETAELVAEIVGESPQVENAARAFGSDCKLRVLVASSPAPGAFTFVEKLSVLGTDGGEATLLQIQPKDAKQIAEVLARVRNLRADADSLQRSMGMLDDDDFQRMKQPGYGYYGRVDERTNIRRALREAASSAETYEEFMSRVRELAATAEHRAQTAEEDPLPVPLNTFSGTQPTLPKYVTNLATRIGQTRVLQLGERRSAIGSEEARRILNLKIERGGQEQLRPIQEQVTALLGVSIDAYQSADRRVRGREPAAELDVDDFLVELNGAGIREALRMILDVEFEKPDILLIEEPEVHLHPALEYRISEYLNTLSTRVQIFATTHSTTFLDNSSGLSSFLVTKSDGSSRAERVSVERDAAVILADLGVKPSALFLFDHLVFVEGPTDEAVLRQWMVLGGYDPAELNVGFIHTVGTRNFRYFAMQSSLQFLIDRGIRVSFIRDRDELLDTDVDRLRQNLPTGCDLVVLGCREIENYLLQPKAIASALRSLGSSSTVEESAIEEGVAKAIEGLRQETSMRHVRKQLLSPLYPAEIEGDLTVETVLDELSRMETELTERRQQLEAVQAQAENLIEERWDSHKQELVPGTEVLEEVYASLGFKFSKPRDPELIAKRLSVEDIPVELRSWMSRLHT